MPGLTLANAISVFVRERGCPGDRDFMLDEIATALEFVMHSGGGDILREWRLPVRDGRVTLPPDLKTPLKFKWSDVPNLGYGTFQSRFFTYSSYGITDCCGYYDFTTKFSISPNPTPTQFKAPKKGIRPFVTTRNKRDVGKEVMVGGKRCNLKIAPIKDNIKVMGDVVKVYLEDDTDKRYGRYVIDDITEVVKPETCDYITLWGYDTETGDMHFLSHYHPDETVPRYTEVQLTACSSWCGQQISILGRIDPSIRYTRDEDVLPITSRMLLKLMAKRSKYDDAGDFNEVATMEARMINIIRKQFAYQEAANKHLSMSLGASGGTVVNM